MNVDSFKASIRSVAPANRFAITFGRASKYFSELGQGYQFLSRDVTIPGQSLKEANINPWGFKRPGVGGLDYDNFPITFICDADVSIHQSFRNWHDDIYDKQRLIVRFYDDYVSDMSIQLFDKGGALVRSAQIYDAFPRDIQDMQLSMDSTDTAMEFTVTFSFWDVEVT